MPPHEKGDVGRLGHVSGLHPDLLRGHASRRPSNTARRPSNMSMNDRRESIQSVGGESRRISVASMASDLSCIESVLSVRTGGDDDRWEYQVYEAQELSSAADQDFRPQMQTAGYPHGGANGFGRNEMSPVASYGHPLQGCKGLWPPMQNSSAPPGFWSQSFADAPDPYGQHLRTPGGKPVGDAMSRQPVHVQQSIYDDHDRFQGVPWGSQPPSHRGPAPSMGYHPASASSPLQQPVAPGPVMSQASGASSSRRGKQSHKISEQDGNGRQYQQSPPHMAAKSAGKGHVGGLPLESFGLGKGEAQRVTFMEGLSDHRASGGPGPPGHATTGGVLNTTVLLRHLPKYHSHQHLTDVLNEKGLFGLYDFVYMPMNFRTEPPVSFGYAFVNFVSHQAALCCYQALQGCADLGFDSGGACEVWWSETHQGLVAHVERYRNSPVMHDNVPDGCKPAVFMNGVRATFPAPSKPLKAPRVRMSRKD
eukprot:TRINITY_DN16296_c0_g1_i1.p1 TRINITY_DN16296_c0_g1~~TRINITY_DN16296_c0_g1_i1.p1  ORF type:complete len:478 (-),score=67.15 TRINITY_DN16296_c0_g1_i1:140-1573(-)